MLVDIAPSILAAARREAPRSMRGTNLWPLWSNDRASEVQPTLGSVSHTEGAWSLRTERAKLIVEMTRRREDLLMGMLPLLNAGLSRYRPHRQIRYDLN